VTTQLLPIAQPAVVRRAAARAAFAAVVLTSCATAATGLVAPWLVGTVRNRARRTTSRCR
jgi:hypothetical protein